MMEVYRQTLRNIIFYFGILIRKVGRFDRGIRPTTTTSPPSFIVIEELFKSPAPF